MINRKKRSIIIIVTACLLVFMGVGYSILSETVKINSVTNVEGKWNIEITGITVEKSGLAKFTNPEYSGLSASLKHELYAPGDSVTYKIKVKNKGNIKAFLSQITSSVDKKYDEVKLTTSGMGQGEILDADIEKEVIIKSEFNKSATTLPEENLSLTYSVDLMFTQYTGSSVVDSSITNISNTCFAVNTDGLITDYDFINCGLNVKVPYSVNGNVVKKVDINSFYGDGYRRYLESEGYTEYINMSRVYDPFAYDFHSYMLFDSDDALERYMNLRFPNKNRATLAAENGLITYVVEDLHDLSKIIIPMNIGYIMGIDNNGNEVNSGATEIIYVLSDWETGLVENENALSACNKYVESGGDITACYIMGSEEADANVSDPYLGSFAEYNITPIYAYFKDSVISRYYNTKIKSLDFSNATGLTEIGSYIVATSLEKVIFNEGLQKIGSYAFDDNPNLGNVDIPSTVTNIETSAFGEIGSDKTIRIRRKDATGLTLESGWNGNATVVYKP